MWHQWSQLYNSPVGQVTWQVFNKSPLNLINHTIYLEVEIRMNKLKIIHCTINVHACATAASTINQRQSGSSAMDSTSTTCNLGNNMRVHLISPHKWQFVLFLQAGRLSFIQLIVYIGSTLSYYALVRHHSVGPAVGFTAQMSIYAFNLHHYRTHWESLLKSTMNPQQWLHLDCLN